MAETVSLIEKSMEIANRLREVSERVKQVESVIADLNLQIADLRIEMAGLARDKLTSELSNSTKRVAEAANLELRDDGLYYYARTPEGQRNGPYCPQCLRDKGKINLLNETGAPFDHFGKWSCMQCREFFA